MRRVSVFLVLFTLLTPAVFSAQQNYNKGKKIGASFLDSGRGIRRAALGGDQIAAAGDAEAVYSNPASLTSLSAAELSLVQNQSFLNAHDYGFTFATPRAGNVFGFGTSYHDEGSEQKVAVDAAGNPYQDGEFRYSTLLLNGSWATSLTRRLATGLTLKGWQDNQGNVSSTGFAADAGLLMGSLLPSFDAAVTVRNMGPSTQGGSLPTALVLGGVFHLPILSLYSQVEFSAHRSMETRFGMEYGNDRFWARGGYQSLTGDLNDPMAHYPLGAGMRIGHCSLDYTWIPGGTLGDQHWVGLKFGFGQSVQEKRELALRLDREMEGRMKEHAEKSRLEAKKSIEVSQWDEAEKKLTQSLLWDPNNALAREELKLVQNKLQFQKISEEKDLKRERVLEIENRKLREKLEQASHATVVTTDEQVVKMNRDAYTLFMLGQTDKAIKIWQKILIDQPANAEAKQALEQAREKQRLLSGNEKQVASRVYELNAQALACYSRGELKQAAQIWRQALAIDSGNAWIKNNLDRVEREMANPKISKKDVE